MSFVFNLACFCSSWVLYFVVMALIPNFVYVHPYLIDFVHLVARHELMLGNTFVAQENMRPPKKEIPPEVSISCTHFF